MITFRQVNTQLDYLMFGEILNAEYEQVGYHKEIVDQSDVGCYILFFDHEPVATFQIKVYESTDILNDIYNFYQHTEQQNKYVYVDRLCIKKSSRKNSKLLPAIFFFLAFKTENYFKCNKAFALASPLLVRVLNKNFGVPFEILSDIPIHHEGGDSFSICIDVDDIISTLKRRMTVFT